MKALNAHFDGKQIVLDEPAKLKPNVMLKVIVADDGETLSEGEASRWLSRLSEASFMKIWDNPLDAAYDKLCLGCA